MVIVLVCDDLLFVWEMLCCFVVIIFGVMCVLVVVSGEEVFVCWLVECSSLVFMDVCMFGIGGMEVMCWFIVLYFEVSVLMMIVVEDFDGVVCVIVFWWLWFVDWVWCL